MLIENKIREQEQNQLDLINEVDQIDEVIPAVLGAVARVGAQVARAGIKVAGQAAKAAGRVAKTAAKGAKRAGKAAARKAKSVGKKVANKAKDKVKKKAKDYVKNKIKDKVSGDKDDLNKNIETQSTSRIKKHFKKMVNKNPIGKMALKVKKGVEDAFDVKPDKEFSKFGGKTYDDETQKDESINKFRMEVRRRLVRELMEADPVGDDGGDGKKGMDPEVAKEIMKSLESKTVKAKSGKEIKVSSALNPQYKKTDPKAHKKATDMFKKAAEDFFSKNSRKKQGGKVPKSPEDLKKKDKKDIKQQDASQAVDTPDQKPDVKKPKPDVKSTAVAKDPKDMTSEELNQQFTSKSKKLDKANSNMERAQSLLRKDPDSPKAKQAVQMAADQRFVAQVGKSQAAMDILDNHKAKEDAIKKEHPNPLSKERRQKLKVVKEEKKKAFEATGMTTAGIMHTMHQKDIKDRWDNSLDPAGEGDQELTQVVNGKSVEVESTRINPETGDVEIVSYELDEDGEKLQDEDGNYKEHVTNEDDMESQTDADESEEKSKERKEYWKDFFADQFDFSDPIDLSNELGLEFGSSSYTAA